MIQMFADPEVREALFAGIVVAVLCGAVGVFVVIRRASFAGHAVTEVGFTGGAGAPLVGASPLAGLLLFSVLGSFVISRLGDRVRERDIATGTVLTMALGLGSLFLWIQTRFVSEPASLLFGSIFAVQPVVLHVTIVIGAAALIALGVLYRPLAYSTISPDSAEARGVSLAFVGAAFLVLLGVAVAETAQLVGVLLTTALLIGPASAATYLTDRISAAMMLAMGIGFAVIVLSIGLAYESYYWPPGGKGWPVSFFVGVLSLAAFLAARGEVRRRRMSVLEDKDT
jgi:zinc/manganese transport system permease protein